MHSVTIIGLIVIFAAYFLFTSLYLKKKRGIKRVSTSILHEDKNRYGIVLQLIVFVGFVFSLMYIYMEMEISELSLAVRMSPFAGLFFMQSLVGGLEEWLRHREEKRYWHEWAASLTILSAFTLILIMEGWIT